MQPFQAASTTQHLQVGEEIGIALGVLTIVAILLSGIWWLATRPASRNSERIDDLKDNLGDSVKQVGSDVKDVKEKLWPAVSNLDTTLVKVNTLLDSHIDECNRRRAESESNHRNHEERIRDLEMG